MTTKKNAKIARSSSENISNASMIPDGRHELGVKNSFALVNAAVTESDRKNTLEKHTSRNVIAIFTHLWNVGFRSR